MVMLNLNAINKIPAPILGIINKIYRYIININYKYKILKRKMDIYECQFYTFEPVNLYRDCEEMLKFVLNNIKKGNVIFDIGANRGIYSLAFASKFKNVRVVAFEPNPEAFKKLLLNIGINNFQDKIVTQKLALSDHNGYAEFFISSAEGRSSLYEYNAKKNEYVREILKVSLETLDYLVFNGIISSPNHIKIDVEGAEYNVLKGAENTLLKYKPYIYIEVHDAPNESVEMVTRKIQIFLEHYGYKIETLNSERGRIVFGYPKQLRS